MAQSPPPARATQPEKWVDEHGDYLFRFALSRLRDHAAAEDAVQETFLAALKAKESFSARSSERTWLVSILKNKIVDHFRRAVREQNLTEPELLPCELERPFLTSGELSRHWNPDLKPLDWGPNPETALDKKEFWDCLQRCIETLPTRLGQVFVRRELDQVSTDEICAELNVTAGNLWVMLHRARMQLRRCLEVNWIGKDTERGATSK